MGGQLSCPSFFINKLIIPVLSSVCTWFWDSVSCWRCRVSGTSFLPLSLSSLLLLLLSSMRILSLSLKLVEFLLVLLGLNVSLPLIAVVSDGLICFAASVSAGTAALTTPIGCDAFSLGVLVRLLLLVRLVLSRLFDSCWLLIVSGCGLKLLILVKVRLLAPNSLFAIGCWWLLSLFWFWLGACGWMSLSKLVLVRFGHWAMLELKERKYIVKRLFPRTNAC